MRSGRVCSAPSVHDVVRERRSVPHTFPRRKLALSVSGSGLTDVEAHYVTSSQAFFRRAGARLDSDTGQ